ncbi:MAG: type II toxin-antitoxin system RelE/ParE family toxin [Verrucomicrobiae bacterium]|nr:type II toxin-antitoxin system RelE/ParE family toxin [Verrucomicrobiae bacterium]
MTHKIYPSARERILEVWEYTEEKWGEDQADRYVAGLVAELDKISKSRHRWKPVGEEGFSGVYFAKYRHHFVFFRELSDGVLGVIAVLHEVMDLPKRLIEEAERNDSGSGGGQ